MKKNLDYIFYSAENLRSNEKIINVPGFKKNVILQWYSETISVCLEKPIYLDKDSMRYRRFNYVNDAE